MSISVFISDQTPSNITNKEFFLESSRILPNYNFIGREEELTKIESILASDRILFMYGSGGEGKTELAKNYFYKHLTAYDTAIFARYESSLQNLIISNQFFEISNFYRLQYSDGEPETDTEYARRKLNEIKKLTTTNSLIVLDNFDTLEDPLLEDFLNGPYKLIITTRTDFTHLGLPIIPIKSLHSSEQQTLFRQYYKRPLTTEDETIVTDIIKLIAGHTLTIELIAKLMNSKRMKPETMYNQLTKAGISPELKGNVSYGFKISDNIYAPIKALFHMENLSENERNILINLSLLPLEGVSIDEFMTWCEIEDFENIDTLIRKSWILYDIQKDSISLHPVISDVVRNECNASFETCNIMIHHLVEWFHNYWNMTVQERTHCGEIAKSLYLKNTFHNISVFDTYRAILKVFNALDYYDLCDRLINDMKSMLNNIPSVELAWYYYELGDLSLQRMQYEIAINYLENSIDIFVQVKPNSYELAYVTKHLAHTCHAIYEHKTPSFHWIEKAKNCLKHSENIFMKCIDFHSSQMGSQLYAMGLNHYYFGEYEKALEYEQLSFDIFMKLNGEINSDTNAPMRVLAMIYSKLGQLEKAVDMQNRVIKAREKLWGTNQFNYFVQHERLADIYFENQMKEEGIRTLQHIIDLMGTTTEQYSVYYDKIQKKLKQYLN